MGYFQDDPFPVDPNAVAYGANQEQAAADADMSELLHIALEQIEIDVEQWSELADLDAFVRGERLA